ncbi:MAG: hypothetical protein M1827_007162 [Pycnora praestabilis]|nr:MAG: hypothetical protein M1827_007162 [Pycnora praestabilis]
MTRSVSGAHSTRVGLRGPPSPTKHVSSYPTLPSNAPEILVKNTIYLKDPHKLLAIRETERKKAIRVLVQRCQRRVSRGPLRRLTAISARTVAYYLASQDNPEKGLCPHQTITPPDLKASASTEPPSLSKPKRGAKSKGEHKSGRHDQKAELAKGLDDKECSTNVRDEGLSSVPVDFGGAAQSSEPQTEKPEKAETTDARNKTKDPRTAARKDWKSFTQHLFDTVPLRMMEWLPIPSTNDTSKVLEAGNQTNNLTPSNLGIRHESSSIHPRRIKNINSKEGCPSMSLQATTALDSDTTLDKDNSSREQRRTETNAPEEPWDKIKDSAERRKLHDQFAQRQFENRQQVEDQAREQLSKGLYSAQAGTASRPAIEDRPRRFSVTQRKQTKPQGAGRPHRTRSPLAVAPNRQVPDADAALISRSTNLDQADTERKPAMGEKQRPKNPDKRKRSFQNGANIPTIFQETPSHINKQDSESEGHSISSFRTPALRKQGRIMAERNADTNTPPQTLSHFSYDIVQATIGLLGSSDTRPRELRHLLDSTGIPNERGKGRSINIQLEKWHDETILFANQSIFYVLSSPEAIKKSFTEVNCLNVCSFEGSSRCLHPQNVEDAFRMLISYNSLLVFHSLWTGLEALFVPPTELRSPKSPRLKPAMSSSASYPTWASLGTPIAPQSPELTYVTNADAAHIITLCLNCLGAALPQPRHEVWEAIHKLRAQGKIVPEADELAARGSAYLDTRAYIDVSEISQCIDIFEDEMALRLVRRVVRAVAARNHFTESLTNRSERSSPRGLMKVVTEQLERRHQLDVERTLSFKSTSEDEQSNATSSQPTSTSIFGRSLLSATIVEWIRSVILKDWDGKSKVNKWGTVGASIEMLSSLYERHEQLGLIPEIFQTPFLADRLDPVEMPAEWIASSSNSKVVHLLSYPFLFPPSALVNYFRAINYSNMSKAFEGSLTTFRLVMQMSFAEPTSTNNESRLENRLRTAMATYLVLRIRRNNVLPDALDQLWRRERRELMRPLRVMMGADEGELGVDYGGVQQEFMGVAIGEALNPDYELFTIDSRTRMSWFQPCSLEPFYKFELLGLLVSLAIYNGLTLPVTFPRALYRKLLDMPVNEISHIRDGWPELSAGLVQLLSWSEGDVGNVFVRTYEFVVDAWGKTISVDMEKVGRDDKWSINAQPIDKGKAKAEAPHTTPVQEDPAMDLHEGNNLGDDWVALNEPTSLQGRTKDAHSEAQSSVGKPPLIDIPGNSDAEASLVTNENREQYVKDYIFWLTDKSVRPQYEAFARGFFVCIDKTALSVTLFPVQHRFHYREANAQHQIFTPEALQNVVEGSQDVDIDGLERTAHYDDYKPSDQVVKDFWSVVKQYTPEMKRNLLEFVTASDRVPVNGIGNVQFCIQRSGQDNENLPTSMTCFGRLCLPPYSSKKKLKEKLQLALENLKGFGNA